MRQDWIDNATELCERKATFYSGCRKILRSRSVFFEHMVDDLVLADAGYTKSKMTMLKKAYLHEESRQSALEQWDIRLGKGKYGSVGFHCYNHLIKGHGNRALAESKGERTGKASRASIMGPCIQSVILTLEDKGGTSVDIFYRTTEFFKKFPADLVFVRDVLLEDFQLPKLSGITFHFANITLHPMYFVTIIPLLDNPIRTLDRIKRRDKYFFEWIVKWTARYICPEHHRGIAKFGQAMRVYDDAHARISKDLMPDLVKYLSDNHPGYRNGYVDPDEDEE